jgi:hypothetical protein
MTFDELFDIIAEQTLSTGAAAPGVMADLKQKGAESIPGTQSLNPVKRGVMELPIPGIDNPELSLSDWEDISFEVMKIIDPTGVLSYKDALIAAGRMNDEFVKKLNGENNHFWLSLLVFVLCVYAALPNVGIVAGGIGGLIQYTGKIGARIARHEITQTMSKAATKELGLLAKITEQYFTKHPEQLISIVNFAAKHELINPEAAKIIDNYFIKNPQISKKVKEMPQLPDYLENNDLLNQTLKVYEDRIAGKIKSEDLIRFNELTRRKVLYGLSKVEEKELKTLSKKTDLNQYDLENYQEALYAKNIRDMADLQGPETISQVLGGAKASQAKFKPEPESTGLSRSMQQIYGKSTGNYYGITGVKGNIITPSSPTLAGIGRGLLTPSQAKVRLGKNLAAGWGTMNEPTSSGGTSQVSPTYRPVAQQSGQMPSYNYERDPITISSPALTNLPPVPLPPQKAPTGDRPAGVKFAPLFQRPAAATDKEPLGRYTPNAKNYSIPDNTMQLFNKNKTNDEGERSAGPMPLFQQLSVQNHNKEEDRKRISREVKKEVNKNIKSFKDSLENLDKDNTSP